MSIHIAYLLNSEHYSLITLPSTLHKTHFQFTFVGHNPQSLHFVFRKKIYLKNKSDILLNVIEIHNFSRYMVFEIDFM